MPYLTPDSIPEDGNCRPLFIPASTDWLAIVSGALTELIKPYNWEQAGAVTVEEAIEAMQAMIDLYYAGCVSGDCVLPDDVPIFRLGEDGHIEQLVGGEWVPPEGDWAIPPTDERTEPTAEERRCLAAANAVNALKILYESLSDSLGSALDAVEAIAALTATIVGGIGLLLGLISGGLIQLAGVAFGWVYNAVEFITADLWDELFTHKLECIFYNCSSDDSGVVHFDFDCINTQLQSQTDLLDPTLTDVRLYGQIAYIMSWLGTEAIDAAGATTAISEAECDSCELHLDLIPSTVDPAPDTIIEHIDEYTWRITGYFNGSDWRCGFKDANGYCINVTTVISQNAVFFTQYDCDMNFSSGIGDFTGGNYNYYACARGDGIIPVLEFVAYATIP